MSANTQKKNEAASKKAAPVKKAAPEKADKATLKLTDTAPGADKPPKLNLPTDPNRVPVALSILCAIISSRPHIHNIPETRTNAIREALDITDEFLTAVHA